MGKNAKPGQGTDGQTICVEMMDITDLGATENQAAGITVMSGSAKHVIKKVSKFIEKPLLMSLIHSVPIFGYT